MSETEHPKRHRRRPYGARVCSGRLILDEGLRGTDGTLSPALCQRLGFPTSQELIYIAISPKKPVAPFVADAAWRIVTLRKQDSDSFAANGREETDTVRLPAESVCGRAILQQVDNLGRGKYGQHGRRPIDINIVNVKPLTLDTVFVSVTKGLLAKVDAAQETFGGGFDDIETNPLKARTKLKRVASRQKANGYWNTTGSAEERLVKLVRQTVADSPIIHEEDTLALPVPSHPITHVAPPPAVVEACHPVAQGIISSRTRIIIRQTKHASENTRSKEVLREQPKVKSRPAVKDDAEDTSNEQFYSANEDRQNESEVGEDGSGHVSDTDSSALPEVDSVSDDSLEDVISLRSLASFPLGAGFHPISSNATPRLGSGSLNGDRSPGSVLSNFTTTTLRAGQRPGKVFRVDSLLKKIPLSAIHPTPTVKDDDTSFIYVEIKMLTRLGCFSGDWVRVEKYAPHIDDTLSQSGVQVPDDDQSDWRAVRIFGISQISPRQRHSSLSPLNASPPSAYISPILLHNMAAPGLVKISNLPKIDPNIRHDFLNPPQAKSITLRKVATPITTRREIQSSLVALLKQYFQRSFRVLKRGDMFPISLDEELGRVTAGVSQSVEGDGDDATSSQLASISQNQTTSPSLAWFVVEQVVQADTEYANGASSEQDRWGGVSLIDPSTIRMAQAGNSNSSIPDSLAREAALWLQGDASETIPSILSRDLKNSNTSSQLYVSPLQKRLQDLITAATSPRAMSFGMPPLAFLLHSSQRRAGKSYVASSASMAAGLHAFSMSAHDILVDAGSSAGGGDDQTEMALKTRLGRALTCGKDQIALILTHLEMLTADRVIPVLTEMIHSSRVFIATTTELEKVPDGIRSLFTHEIQVGAPSEKEREGILYNVCLQQTIRLDAAVQLGKLALKTAALVAGDLVDVVHRASLAHTQRLEILAGAKDVSVADLQLAGGSKISTLLTSDFDVAVGHARSTFSDSIGAPKIPTVTWDDVGGLADQKASIMETISLPLSHPELFAKGMRKRSGILFYGPPGTGKTLLAKAIATEFNLNFFSVKGPELLNMYIGESEANVRRVFQRARDARPCVVFFDELDSVAPKRGNQGDSGGVMDRIVSQLLAELDGMSGGSSSSNGGASDQGGNEGGVFVIGATNRPDLLDPALLRPGRFDKMLYLGVSSTHDQQHTILRALTRKFSLSPDIELSRVASRLPLTYTGADLYALCSDAMLKAITRKTTMVDTKIREMSGSRGQNISTGYYFDRLAVPEDTIVVVGEDDFAAAQRELVASVSAKELAHFELIRERFEQQDQSHKEAANKLTPARPSGPANRPQIAASVISTTKGPPTWNFKPSIGRDGKRGPQGKRIVVANPDSGPEDSEDSDVFQTPSRSPRDANGDEHGEEAGGARWKGKGRARNGFTDVEENLYG